MTGIKYFKPEDPEFFTIAELVERYRGQVTATTLSNWRTRGEGPQFTKIGGRVLYRVEHVVAWEATRTSKS